MAKLLNEKEFQKRLELLCKKISLSFVQKRNELHRAQDDMDDYGYSRKTVQRIESGATDYTISDLLKMCMTFEISLTELLELPDIEGQENTKEIKTEKKLPNYNERKRGSKYWKSRADKAKRHLSALIPKKKKK